MRTPILFFVFGLILSSPPTHPTPPEPPPPVSVFAALDGTWAGTFVGYDSAGKELYRIAVKQTYRTISDTQQSVVIHDTTPDGTVISGRGMNLAHRAEDGSLALRCTITKSDGERIDHRGRIVTGPESDEQIIWYTNTPGRIETFREAVYEHGGETIYEINGLGRYGETLILMNGRYRKTTPSEH